MTNYKYFNFDKSPYASYECYFISGSIEVWEQINKLPQREGALIGLQTLMAALFGLSRENFYNYIAVKYNASIKSNSYWKSIFFSNIKDANDCVKELNKRMTYAVANKFFEDKEELDNGSSSGTN